MDANNAIEGVEKDKEMAALMEEWDREGLSDDEQIKRMLELVEAQSVQTSSFGR